MTLCLKSTSVELVSTDVATEGQRALDARVARSRAAVLDAGKAVLFAEGWDAITHLRLAEAADVGRATIYRHWPTVDDLLIDVIANCSPPDHLEKLSGNTRADLIDELQAFFETLQEGGVHEVLVTVMERSLTNERFAEIHKSLTRRSRQVVWKIVSDAIERRELDPNLTEEAVAAQTLGPLLYRRLHNCDDVHVSDIEASVDAFLAAFAA